MDTAEVGEACSRGRLKERFEEFEARKKALFCNLSRRLVRSIVKHHGESLELLGNHKE